MNHSLKTTPTGYQGLTVVATLKAEEQKFHSFIKTLRLV